MGTYTTPDFSNALWNKADFENNNASRPGYRPSIVLADTLPVTPSTYMLPTIPCSYSLITHV
jgi:hypothetical protein